MRSRGAVASVIAPLLVAAAVALTRSPPAFAPVNVVGYWNPLVADEDFIERVPGPNTGDYAADCRSARLIAETEWTSGTSTRSLPSRKT